MTFPVPPQSDFFYQSKWNAEMDAFLLCVIITQFKMGNWKATRIPAHETHSARGSLNDAFPSSFTWNGVYELFMLMKNRFRTFKEVVAIPGTIWDTRENCIIAVDGVWQRIFEKNELAKAYYHVGESEFDKLAILFGPDDIKVEHLKTVVIISDTTIPLDTGKTNDVWADLDEVDVTSLLPNTKGTTYRRLFDNDQHTTDIESTNNKGSWIIEEGRKGNVKSHFEMHPYKKKVSLSSCDTFERWFLLCIVKPV